MFFTACKLISRKQNSEKPKRIYVLYVCVCDIQVNARSDGQRMRFHLSERFNWESAIRRLASIRIQMVDFPFAGGSDVTTHAYTTSVKSKCAIPLLFIAP